MNCFFSSIIVIALIYSKFTTDGRGTNAKTGAYTTGVVTAAAYFETFDAVGFTLVYDFVLGSFDYLRSILDCYCFPPLPEVVGRCGLFRFPPLTCLRPPINSFLIS
jgi:hypothetical protein